jgi:hypothetical protein
MQASVYIATSLDGFIARVNGDLDWLATGESADSGEDYGYAERGARHLYVDGGKTIQRDTVGESISRL